MKFDIVVGNPPYGERPSGISATLHLQIMKTVLDFCTDKLCFIMPSKPITSQLDKNGIWYNMFKNAVCTDVEVVKKDTFKNTTMDDTAIYYIDRKPGSQFCKKFDVDYTIYNVIDDDAHKLFIDKMGKFDSLQIFRTYNVVEKNDETQLKKNVEKWVSEMSDDKYYLNINRANGSLCGKLISGDLVSVGILNKEEEHQFMYKHTSVKNILQCPTKKYGENLKNLMIYGKVLRYGLWLTQTNQNVYQGQLKYVPDIDYTTIDTDEKLLSVCGFSDDEIKVIMKYLKDFDFTRNRNDVVRGTEETPIERRLKAMKKVNKKKYDNLFNRWGMSKREDGYKGTFEEFAEEQLRNNEEDED